MKNLIIKIFLILSLIFFVQCGSDEQTPTESAKTGAISGTISDYATGLPIYGANITTYAPSSAVTTDTSGAYTIINVPPATYTVSATKAGYYTDSVKVEIYAGLVTPADIQLKQDTSSTIIFH